jgi:ABC-type transport system involved in Fe-S cluster assembly fused permease/ATPase subunit
MPGKFRSVVCVAALSAVADGERVSENRRYANSQTALIFPIDNISGTLQQSNHAAPDETPINEAASSLSEGQKQLLTIARAFLVDPAILILDEATSSVDTRTEILIQRAMADLMRGRTTFVIAHRLSTIRNADVILMMEHGRIVEKGTHQELLAAKGRYAELYYSQFAGRAAQAVSVAS